MKNKLDKLFKDKLYNRTFEFKDAYWKQAEQLLVRKRRRRRLWLFSIILLLAFAGAGSWWLLDQPSEEPYSPINQQQAIHPVEINTLENIESSDSKTIPTESLKEEKENTDFKDQDQPSSYQSSILEYSGLNDKNASPSFEVTSPTENKRATKNKEENIFVNNASQNKSIEGMKEIENVEVIPVKTPVGSDRLTISGEAEKEVTYPVAEDSKRDEIMARKTNLSNLQRLPSSKSIDPLENNSVEDAFIALGGPITRNQVNRWHGGVSVSSSFTENINQSGNLGLHSLMVGFEGYYLFNNNMGLHSGLLYRQQRGGVDIEFASSQTTFGFGFNRTDHAIDIKELHWVTVPLYLSYIGYKHQVGIGAHYHFLVKVNALQTKSVATSFSELRTLDEEQIDFNSEMIRSYQLSSFFQYSYRITPRTRIGARFIYDFFTPVKQEATPEDQQWQRQTGYRPWRVGIFLNYDLF